MKMEFLGAARTVTGSSILLDTGQEKILVDCGLYQGTRELEERNYLGFDYAPAEIDFVLLTHAHIDHSGLLPRLWKLGFRGKIVTTSATVDMCGVMLRDSAAIHERDAVTRSKRRKKEGGPPREPLYLMADAEGALHHLWGMAYNQKTPISKNLAVRFCDAGHILGSASVELWVSDPRRGEVKLAFSGDLGNHPVPILRTPQPVEDADYLVIESTYGDRLHEHRDGKADVLREIIMDTVSRSGRLIIPSFAVGRTQELLYYLNGLIEGRHIPPIPVFVDSPMAVSATEIYRSHTECYDEGARALLARHDSPFDFPGLEFTRELEESKRLNTLREPCVVISASGMATHGRIRHHLVNGLPDERNTVLFVGFQALGTLGRELLDGAKSVRIFGQDVHVRASVRSASGFSAHADRDGLLQWLRGLQGEPQLVFVNHGEEAQSLAFAETVHREFGLGTTVPEPKAVFELELHPPTRPVVVRGAEPPPPVRRQAVHVERVADNLLTQLKRLFSDLAEADEELEHEGRAADVQSTAVLLDDLHKALLAVTEAALEGTEAALRREMEARGLMDTKPWSELLRLVGVRRRTVVQSHEELRSTILKLAERLPPV
jgi:metallo-beta-lactamase family protein